MRQGVSKAHWSFGRWKQQRKRKGEERGGETKTGTEGGENGGWNKPSGTWDRKTSYLATDDYSTLLCHINTEQDESYNARYVKCQTGNKLYCQTCFRQQVIINNWIMHLNKNVIMRCLHCLIRSFILCASALPERSYLCIVETTHHHHVFINMIVRAAAFVSAISPIYIQPQSGPWFEYPENAVVSTNWSGAYGCIFAKQEFVTMRDFFFSCGCTNEFLLKATSGPSIPRGGRGNLISPKERWQIVSWVAVTPEYINTFFKHHFHVVPWNNRSPTLLSHSPISLSLGNTWKWKFNSWLEKWYIPRWLSVSYSWIQFILIMDWKFLEIKPPLTLIKQMKSLHFK